jgi:hypothetical protein
MEKRTKTPLAQPISYQKRIASMQKVLLTVEEVTVKILNGEKLILAGDERVLSRLPGGNWIGGTIPYFIGENGGEFSQEKIFVTELPPQIANLTIRVYNEKSIERVYLDIPQQGFGIIILPSSSKTHLSFALNAPSYEEFATRPLIGWVSGVFLQDLGIATPKVFNGITTESLEDAAVVMQVTMPPDQYAEIDILNIFVPGDGDSLTFLEDGFSAREVEVNGFRQDFVEYLDRIQADIKLPLVANYYGAMVNISIQALDRDRQQVQFYAPVFRGITYKLARPVENYVNQFCALVPGLQNTKILFSCNCILNYLYSELEGKKTGEIMGPITFGEVAYQLLNQTMVYLSINDQV